MNFDHACITWNQGYHGHVMARDELVATLEESLRIQQQLVDDARNDHVPVEDLVAQILTQKSVLERLGRQRDELVSRLRHYIAPALNPDGSANPRWITSSAWQLDRRIVASPQTERLFDLYKIYALAGRPGSAEASIRGPRPFDALLAQYAKKILGTEPPPVSASADEISAWRERVRDHAGALIGEIRRDDEPHRKQMARQLADLPERDRIWGVDTDPRPGQPQKPGE